MMRVKHTPRKTNNSSPTVQANKSHACHRCQKTFTGANNLTRHLGLVHGVDQNNRPISEERRATYRGYNAKRGCRKTKRASTSTATTSVATASVSRPSTSSDARRSGSSSEESVGRYATPGSVATPPRLDQPVAAAADATPVRAATPKPVGVRRVKVKGQSKRDGRKKNAPVPTTSLSDPTARKPTRPKPPVSRTVRPAVDAAITPVPRVAATPSKRKVRLSPDGLARKVARAGRRTSQSLADDLANEYSMPPNDRRAHQNIVIGMKAARRQLCAEVRRALPLNRTEQDIKGFLDKMEQLCKKAESGPSDEEFV